MTSKVLESKRAYRRKLAGLPPAEKLRILEEMRGRAQMRQGSRQSALPKPPAAATDFEQNPQNKDSTKKRAVGLSRSKATAHRFGGRATAGGVNYEVRVAAFIAVKMLSGSQCSVGMESMAQICRRSPCKPPSGGRHCRESAWRRRRVRLHFSKGRSGTIALTKKVRPLRTHKAFVQTVPKTCLLRPRRKVGSSGAVPSCVGRATTHELLDVLETHRRMLATLH